MCQQLAQALLRLAHAHSDIHVCIFMSGVGVGWGVVFGAAAAFPSASWCAGWKTGEEQR